MADRQDDRRRHFEIETPDTGDETVRILPEQVDRDEDGSGDGIRSGTLYTPAASRRMQPYQPEERTHRRALATTIREDDYSEQEESRALAHENEKAVVAQVRRGPSGCAILAGTFSLLALACALLGFATLQGGLDGLSKLGGIFPKFGLPISPTVTIDTSRPAVIEKVRALNKLETVHYQMEKVVTGKSTNGLPEFLVSDKILLVAHGEVVAGIDMSKMQPEDIVVKEERVTITLPKAEILYSKLDNSKTYVYDRQTGVFNKPDPNLETKIRQAAEQEIVKAAMEDDILGKAQVNGEQVIRTLVTGLGYKDVEVKQAP